MLQESVEILPIARIEEGNSSITWEESVFKTRGRRGASPFMFRTELNNWFILKFTNPVQPPWSGIP